MKEVCRLADPGTKETGEKNNIGRADGAGTSIGTENKESRLAVGGCDEVVVNKANDEVGVVGHHKTNTLIKADCGEDGKQALGGCKCDIDNDAASVKIRGNKQDANTDAAVFQDGERCEDGRVDDSMKVQLAKIDSYIIEGQTLTSDKKSSYCSAVNKFFQNISSMNADCYFADYHENTKHELLCSFNVVNGGSKDKISFIIKALDDSFSMKLSNKMMFYDYVDSNGNRRMSKSNGFVSTWLSILGGDFKYNDVVFVSGDALQTEHAKRITANVQHGIVGFVVRQASYKIIILFSLYHNGNISDILGWLIFNNDTLETSCLLANVRIHTLKSEAVSSGARKISK